MKKVILLLVAVSCLGFANSQTITQILGKSNMGIANFENLDGATITYMKNTVFGVQLKLAFEFTNGSNELEVGDIIVIGGTFSQEAFSDGDSIEIGGVPTYKGFLFNVTENIAPGATFVFEEPYPVAVTNNGYQQIDERTFLVGARARCSYTSKDGDLLSKNPPLPETTAVCTLVNNTAVSEAALAVVRVFPTLVTGEELQLTNLVNTDVAIYSLVGQQMIAHSNLTGNASVDVSTLANGIYFVRMQNGSAVRTEKIKIVR
ncbi:MAG: T9SS type A sorting domain-containing protein [Lentimicrobiaceae bacterium]|nr:T9SS type A sorting domain-containing protein [Lentimicrobiaceae bacterium]